MFDVMRFTALGFFEDQIFSDDLFTQFEFSVATVEELINKSSRAQRIVVLDSADSVVTAINHLNETDHRALVKLSKSSFESKSIVFSD
jgi:hypothetical protein